MVDRSESSHFPVAKRVLAAARSGTVSTFAESALVQGFKQPLRIAHEAGRLLDGIAVLGLLAKLALIGYDAVHARLRQ